MLAVGIVGIDTGVGKTVASAVIADALQSDYWKPFQAGSLDFSDSHCVRQLISNKRTRIFPEAIKLKHPVSPHASARLEGKEINLDLISFPKSSNLLIVETAGGLMTPLNDRDTMLSFLVKFNLPVVLVSKNYLGSINHTLLTLEVLNQYGLSVQGILFNGEPADETEHCILSKTRAVCLGRIPKTERLDKGFVAHTASVLRPMFVNYLLP